MAIAIVLYFRNKNSIPSDIDIEIDELNKRLTPETLFSQKPRVVVDDNIILGVLNPNDNVRVHQHSIGLGLFYETARHWWEPMSPSPDGSYALFRCNKHYIELVSDGVGTRTIWYVLLNDVFFASTSQRALIYFLKSFEFNEDVIPWVLSSGSLGPKLSWDRRIQRLGSDERLLLNRDHWRISLHTTPCNFKPCTLAYKDLHAEMTFALKKTIGEIRSSLKAWALSLSGGYDSRALLILLKDLPGLNCLSWGCHSLMKEPDNDGSIAKKLSLYFQVPLHYYDVNTTSENVWKVFKRFLAIGEGRIDHIRWYMDGFKTWDQIAKTGFQTIIRGDEGFGWRAVSSGAEVYNSMGLTLFSRLLTPKQMLQYDLSDPVWPGALKRQANESLSLWRDRLYHCYRIPSVLAALTDLKLPYVEVANPLLSRRIIHIVRMLPDELRTDKRLFKDIVTAWSPPIPFAKAKLRPEYFPREQLLHRYLFNQLDHSGYLSPQLKKLIKASKKPTIDPKKLILRSFIMTEMTKLLDDDAKTGSTKR